MYLFQQHTCFFAEYCLFGGVKVTDALVRVNSVHPCIEGVSERIVAAGGDLYGEVHVQTELVMYILREHGAFAVALVVLDSGRAQYQLDTVAAQDMVFVFAG